MRLKWVIAAVAGSVFLAAWAAVVVGFLLGAGLATWTVLVTIAAFATEGLIWSLALVLGLTVFEARRKIWRALTGPFRGRAAGPEEG